MEFRNFEDITDPGGHNGLVVAAGGIVELTIKMPAGGVVTVDIAERVERTELETTVDRAVRPPFSDGPVAGISRRGIKNGMTADFVSGFRPVDGEVEGVGGQVDKVSLAVTTVQDAISGQEPTQVSPTGVTNDATGGRVGGVLTNSGLETEGVITDDGVHRAKDSVNLEAEVGHTKGFRTGLVSADDPTIAFVFEVIFHLLVSDIGIVGFVGVLSLEGLPGVGDGLAGLVEPGAGQTKDVVDVVRIIAVVMVKMTFVDWVDQQMPLGGIVFGFRARPVIEPLGNFGFDLVEGIEVDPDFRPEQWWRFS